MSLHSLTTSSSFGSALGQRQKFPPEYLAKQLPVFQERVPKVAQESLKFPTDAPPNLPLPPLLPGEEVLLQQHRVVCLDTFAEPAVGSIYITNFRIIFNGNSISDPESRESIMEGLPAKKESTFSLDAGKLPRIRSTATRPSATFNSYLTNPEQVPSKKSKWNLNSLRRSNRSPTEDFDPIRKSASLRHSAKNRSTNTESTDGPSGGSSGGGVWSDIGSVLNRGARSLRIPGKKKQASKDAVQWDSVSSVSSMSELSECPTTGTDEASERELELNTCTSPNLQYEHPMFTVGSVDTAGVLLNGSAPNKSGCVAPLIDLADTPIISPSTDDDYDHLPGARPTPVSGQNGSVTGGTQNGNREEVDFEKYSSSAVTFDPNLETEAQRLELQSSVDPSLLLDPSLEKKRQERTRRSWFHRSTSPSAADSEDSASDEDSEDDEKIRTLTQDTLDGRDRGDSIGYSKVEILAPKLSKSAPERSNSPVYSVPVKVTGRGRQSTLTQETSQERGDTAAQQLLPSGSGGEDKLAPRKKPLPPTPPKKPRGLFGGRDTSNGTADGERTEIVSSENEQSKKENYLNEEEEEGREGGGGGRGEGERGCTAGEGEGYANSSVVALCSEEKRDRSISNPWPLKKPVPLPRNDKASTMGRLDPKDRGFGSSLPADFKPTPTPRKTTLPSPPRPRPPISPKPSLLLLLSKPSPPPNSGHRVPPPLGPPSQDAPAPPCPSVTDDCHDTTSPTASPPSNCHQTSDRAEDTENGERPEKQSDHDEHPAAPPRRRKKARTMPAQRQALSPIYSPIPESPVKTVAVPSDAGSSDPPDTSSESDHSHPRCKFLSSPSPVPRSPSPLEWQEEQSQDSSMITQCHSVPSIRSSFPASPLDVPSTYGYVGDREPLPAVSARNTASRHPPARSISPLPTSTRYSFSSSLALFSIHSIKKLPALLLKEDGVRLPEGIIVRARNVRSMKLHVHPHNRYDAEGLKELLEKKILAEMLPQELFAFHYCAAIRHPNPNFLHTTALPNFFKLQDEIERLHLAGSRVWHVSSVLKENPDLSPSYPREVIVPRCIPDLDILRGAKLYRHGRFPTLTWISQDSSVFLLRAAPTVTRRGQSGGSGMCLDEAILQAVCMSTEKARASTKLYIFTEKPESTPTALSDPMHTSLTEAQKRAYYYHNCQFEYSVTPPTFKNIRHSLNKLAAVLEESKVGEDEFLIALDDTRWLHRIQELLQTAAAVVGKLEEESASVLVCYESGCDRTAQISSLAQLLLDPYYRTMDGFQILIQKEWLWFGHPFHSRHSRQGRVKEDGPVFLQWVDCIWQVMHQCPSAFEFNEKFLTVLVENSYSGQFGTFLLNNEQERRKTFSDKAHKHKSVVTHTLSFWMWVSMVNAAGRTFYNHLYDPQTYPWVIYPNCTVPCLKLWTNHYSQSKFQEHNSTNTTALQKQLDQLVREYQKLNSHVDLSTLATTRAPSISTSSSSFSDDRSTPRLERERERVRQSGRSSRSKTPVLYHTIEQYLTTQGIDTTVCKHAEIAGNTCQGALVKLGGVRKNWQERWFVLDFASQLLTYFENREAYTETDRGTPKGVIELNDMSKVWQNTKKKDHLVRHVFTVETKNRTYLFRAPSLLTMQLWIALLNMPSSALQVDV